MTRRRQEHRIQPHPDYVAALRQRVAVIGFRAVARVAGIGLAGVHRAIAPATADRPATLDAIERVRAAIAELEPEGAPIPPPVAAVRGPTHAAWIALGDQLEDRGELVAALAAMRRRVR